MKKKIVLLVGTFMTVSALTVHAADLRVKGAISPVSCSFTITNSVIDYGNINPSSLSATNYTRLTKKATPYVIKCGSHARAKVGIKVVDNRASTRIPNLVMSQIGSNYTDNHNYGLGANTKSHKVGGYVVHLRNSVANGKAVNVLTSANNGASWIRGGEANKTSELDMSSQLNLDGQATLELHYL